MARARRSTRKPKEAKEKKPRAKKAKPAKPKPEPVAEEVAGEGPDLLPTALVVLTAGCLLVATILAWMQLGKFGAGPFG